MLRCSSTSLGRMFSWCSAGSAPNSQQLSTSLPVWPSWDPCSLFESLSRLELRSRHTKAKRDSSMQGNLIGPQFPRWMGFQGFQRGYHVLQHFQVWECQRFGHVWPTLAQVAESLKGFMFHMQFWIITTYNFHIHCIHIHSHTRIDQIHWWCCLTILGTDKDARICRTWTWPSNIWICRHCSMGVLQLRLDKPVGTNSFSIGSTGRTVFACIKLLSSVQGTFARN